MMLRYAMLVISGLLVGAGWARAQDAPGSLEEADRAIEKSFAESGKKEAPAASAGQKSPLRFPSATPGGETGLLRVMEAGSTDTGTIRLSVHGGFFVSSGEDGFLNYNAEPNYNQSQVVGRLSLAYTPLPFLEVFASLRNSSNKNTASQPELLQTQGDVEFGAKGFYPVLPYLGVGLDAGVGLLNGIGQVTPDLGGTSVHTKLLLTFDTRGLEPTVPLRVHLNGGFIFENSDSLKDGRDLTWIEEYALRVNQYNRVALGFGIDAPLPYADPVAITPFIEFTAEIPVGINDETLSLDSNLGNETKLSYVIPMRLTPGVRVTYLKDLTLDLAVDISISFAEGGKKAYLYGVPSTPPYTVWLGLTYAFDPLKRGEEKVVERVVERQKVVEKEVPVQSTTGRITGRVTNALDRSPVDSVIVSFESGGITPVATEPKEGRYETYDLTAGIVRLIASKAGFKPQSLEAEVKVGESTELNFVLEPELGKGTISGTVSNERDKPMLAKVDIRGPAEFHLDSAQGTGAFATEAPAGSYVVRASAAGYLAKARHFIIKENETVMAEFKLSPEPPKRVVIVEKDKLVVQKKIHFATGKAIIQTDSFIILDEVVDVLVNHTEIKRIRIEGHTDSQGSDSLNLKLSQRRADAVRTYLVDQGIPGETLEAKGYGESKPIAPNSTRRGREQNRRVEFAILDQ